MSDSLGPSGSKRSAWWRTATPVKDRGTATKRCCFRSRRAGNGGRNSAADSPSTVRKRMSPAGGNLVASSLVSLGAKYLKTTFGPKALADFCDSCFASVERTLARMNGVGAEHEVVGMLDGRTQDEAGVFKSLEFEGAARLLEHGQLALVHDLRRSQLSLVHGDPGDGMILRRLVTPFLALLQRNVQVVDGGRRGDFAAGLTVVAKDDARRTMRLEVLASEVLCLGFDAFHLRRKGDP